MAMFGLSGVPRFPSDTPDKVVAAEVDGMGALRHYKCRKQDRVSGREDRRLADRNTTVSRSVSTRDHSARGRGEYAYGSTMGNSVLSSMPDDRTYGEFTHFEHLREHSYDNASQTKFKIKPREVRGQGKNYARMSYLHKATDTTSPSVGPGSYCGPFSSFKGNSQNMIATANHKEYSKLVQKYMKECV
eukprot:TRINITY_DN5317_c0_g1_i2.p1 TRINITY_DN5317_c0_g1~~TRINITY_DN5317_c0_g1_i2.p1  ORF type:complete len:188 (+),score=12.78 TRINITY_DN5317_c0_g1_i2:240-803(+)